MKAICGKTLSGRLGTTTEDVTTVGGSAQFKGKLLEFLKHVDPGRKVGSQKPLYLVLGTREGLCVVESLPSRIGSKGGACVSSISRWG